jgi:heptosyltransferase-2
VRNLCGTTALVDAVDLLALSAVAVSNDSGLMHVAAAVGTAVVALYGSSTPDFTPPLTVRASIHYRRLACSPCFARDCPLGHRDCLRGIDVESVAGSVERALATAADR